MGSKTPKSLQFAHKPRQNKRPKEPVFGCGKTWLCAAEKAKLLIKANLGSCQAGEGDLGPGASAVGRNEVVVDYL